MSAGIANGETASVTMLWWSVVVIVVWSMMRVGTIEFCLAMFWCANGTLGEKGQPYELGC